ncbi:MAG: ribosome small subunit-dependent GTPase A [Ferrovum sp.]|nr:ribosome small subunit-dependent GTPase A [Ferrovum sp.]NDU86832.1 ribosome small subunit-dependent GTPase A [Ferrovum sp.]
MSIALRSGQVMGVFGQHTEVLDDHGALWSCVQRGKRHDVACGDVVGFTPSSSNQGVIEHIAPRDTLFYRADARREKFLAANVDQVVIVTAGEPTPSQDLLSRCLVAAEASRVAVLVIHNKADLVQASSLWRPTLAYYQSLGYRVIELSAVTDTTPLLPYLSQHRSLLVGQSGMGKSTLLNALIPEARATTQAISLALDSGCHTTTATRAYALPEGGQIFDSPGVQAFGLSYLSSTDLPAFFPEFSALQGHCRFPDCHHLKEPGCAFKAFAGDHPQRLQRLATLLDVAQENARTRLPSAQPGRRRQQTKHHDPEDEGAP